MKSVLVALSHKNSAKTLRQCLQCIQANDYPNFKVVVVDAGSTDGSIQIAQSFLSDSRFVFKLLPGCTEGGGEQWAIDNFPSDIYLFTTSDIYTQPDWVALHAAWHEMGYDMVGGRQTYVGDRFDFAWSTEAPKQAYSSLTQGMGLGFTNCSVGRGFYDKIGGVDASLWYGTDMDFFLRAITAGAKIALDPRIRVVHDHPLNTFINCWRKSYSYGRIQILLLRLHYNSRTKWPGYPRWIAPKYLIPWNYIINGVAAWEEQRGAFLEAKGEDGSPVLRWLFNRYWAVGFAYRLGAVVSMIKKPDISLLKQKKVTYGKRYH